MSLRALVFNIVFYLNLALLLVFGSPLLFGPRRYAMVGLKCWGWTTMWWQRFIVSTRVEVRGRENIPPGALLVAAKHQSAWETVTLHTLFADPAMVLKKELMWLPAMGWFNRKFRLIPIDRAATPRAVRALLIRAREAVAAGRQIIVFPEGTRRAPGAAPDYKPGISLLYAELGVPCLPVALNSGLYWPRRKAQRHPGTIVVEILPPIPPGLSKKDFLARLKHDIETASNRLIAEAAASENPPPLPESAADVPRKRKAEA
jgi:1-acyl-sn-glycerol-3-phosphate acyltransferase